MDWQTLLTIAGVIAIGLVALRLAFSAVGTMIGYAGIAMTTAAVALHIAPGLIAGDRALAQLAASDRGADARRIDALREKVRRDVIARADMYSRYPRETALVTNRVRA